MIATIKTHFYWWSIHVNIHSNVKYTWIYGLFIRYVRQLSLVVPPITSCNIFMKKRFAINTSEKHTDISKLNFLHDCSVSHVLYPSLIFSFVSLLSTLHPTAFSCNRWFIDLNYASILQNKQTSYWPCRRARHADISIPFQKCISLTRRIT